MNKEIISKYPSKFFMKYVDTDIAYADYKQKISSIYGSCCKDKSILTKINKSLRIAKRG